MADEKDREEIIVAEFHKKIKEAFEVFDHESNNTVDVSCSFQEPISDTQRRLAVLGPQGLVQSLGESGERKSIVLMSCLGLRQGQHPCRLHEAQPQGALAQLPGPQSSMRRFAFHKRKEARPVQYRRRRREIGTIIRSLGCCPTEGELHDLIAEVEEEEPTGYIRFEKFLPVMTEILLERRYRPIPEDVLLRAFEVLDSAKRGFLTKDELIKYMTEEGEPFSQEEMEEMLSAAIDPESNSIHYKDYITMMVIDEN
uniref:EF-hand calcium binding domain 2 n=1 Tax=Macaca mulatta TaxID=9544 RepID=A0A5F7ZV72_MACMU